LPRREKPAPQATDGSAKNGKDLALPFFDRTNRCKT